MRERSEGLNNNRNIYFHVWSMVLLLAGFVMGGSGVAVASDTAMDGIASQQALTVAEQHDLQRAIEDYQFQEQSKSIARLEKMNKIHPTNLEVLHYLGLSYEETQQYIKAQTSYAMWLKYSGNRMDKDARFAWVGMAKSYDKSGHTAMGVKLLKRWLTKHPKDYDTIVALGDMLVRAKRFEEAKLLFHNMLAQKELSVSKQSSARYYLGYAAWLEGDASEVKNQGERMLRIDPESPFASVIKQLMEMPPPRRLGLNITAGIDGFYVDNVASKPSYGIASNENDRTTGTNLALGLTWNFRHHIAANYNFGGTFYSKRPDLNIGLHMMGMTWADQGFQVGPRYEYVTMYNKQLYQGVGADFGWGDAGWILLESVRYKRFSKNVKVLDPNSNAAIRADLSSLGGWSSSFMVMKQTTWGKAMWMLGANFAFERTKGNASTDRRLSDYQQLGGSMNVMYPDGALVYAADVNGYIKKYRGIDATILNAKRKDEYIHLGAGVTWTPAEQKRHSLTLKTEWNNNASNYDFPNLPNGTKDSRSASAAAYKQWKHTIGYAFVW